MKRIKTRVLALLLSCCLVTVGIVGNYQTAQAAEIVAGGALVGTLEEILLSFGLFLLPSSMIDSAQNPDWWYSEDGNAALKPYYEDLATEYEKERFKVINGGGNKPQPSPTPEPGTTPEVTPVPTGDIPTFDELVAPALAGGAIAWANGAFDVMGKAVSNLWDKIFGTVSHVNDGVDKEFILENAPKCSGMPYYLLYYDKYNASLDSETLYFFKYGALYNSTDTDCYVVLYGGYSYGAKTFWRDTGKLDSVYDYFDRKYSSTGFISIETIKLTRLYNYFTNMPKFDSYSDARAYVEGQMNNADKYVKENIWVHPDLQNTYQNNGKFEYPAQAPQPLQYPSAENLADLAKKLNPEINPDYSPEIAPNYVQELIQKLQKNPTVNPDPDPNPDPNPKPDPGTDPQPTLAPNPTGAPEQPEKPEDEVKPYTADLKDVFPFCIPFDLIHLFEVFDAEPEAPVFKIPIELKVNNPFTGKSIVDYEDTIKIDLSDYEQPIKVIRIFEVIFFLIGLMLITRSHMIKG